MTAFPKYERYKDSGVEWLGEIPEHWHVSKTRWLWREVEDPSANGDEQLLSISQYTGVTPTNAESRSESLVGYRRCKLDDLAMNIMLAWQGGLGVSNYEGIVSPAYSVFRLRGDNNSHYLGYLYRTKRYLDEFGRNSTGIVPSRWRLYPDKFGHILTLLPPKPEQDRIVAFLDQKTAEIDALIAKKQRQIELLDEQKAILINRAVTRGFNSDAKIKSSGIDLIGEIPEHWEVLQLRRLQRYGTSITYGIVQAGPDIEDGIPYLRTSDMKGAEFGHSGFLKTSHKIDNAYRRSKVEEGDLVIAIRATLGKALRVPKHLHGANLTQGTAKVAPGPRLDSKFLAYAFNSSYCQEAVLFVGKGTTFLEITLEALRRIQLVVPPMAEQVQIVGAIDRAVDLHRESVGLTLKEIQSLKSLRNTLIAHAVTGRIKV